MARTERSRNPATPEASMCGIAARIVRRVMPLRAARIAVRSMRVVDRHTVPAGRHLARGRRPEACRQQAGGLADAAGNGHAEDQSSPRLTKSLNNSDTAVAF